MHKFHVDLIKSVVNLPPEKAACFKTVSGAWSNQDPGT